MRPIRARQRRDPVTGKRYPWLCQERAMVNHCLREIPLGLAVAADRSDYLGGFERTMLTHIDGSASAQSVLGHSWYWAQSKAFSSDWPNASDFLAVFGPLAEHINGPLLVEDPAVAEYYLPAGAQWQRWSSSRNITLPSGTYTGGPGPGASVTGAGNAPVYANYIARGYFSLVALNFTDTTGLDRQIAADLRRNPHYHVVQVVCAGVKPGPFGPIEVSRLRRDL